MTLPLLLTDNPANTEPRFRGASGEVAPGVFMVADFVNVYAVRTDAGLVLIDTGTTRGAATVHKDVRGWDRSALHAVVYTHGHVDHVCGLAPFLAAGDRPAIVAQESCPRRFRRYQLTHGYNQVINRRQFGNDRMVFPSTFVEPTITFRDGLVHRVGTTELHITAARGETDDHCYTWLPDRRYLFCGDLVIWRSPNCGNPQKVQRYPVEWAETLEAMAKLDAEWLFPGHGHVVKGRDAVRLVLTDTARYLRHIIDQVLPRLNAGEAPDDIVEAVASDPVLAAKPYLREEYDHPKFIVRNLIRLWGGWWNGKAADLLPATAKARSDEIAMLAGGVGRLVARGRELLAKGDTAMAAHVAEWATTAAPADADAQALKRDVFDRCLAGTTNLMAQGIYRGAANEARGALGEERVQRPGRATL